MTWLWLIALAVLFLGWVIRRLHDRNRRRDRVIDELIRARGITYKFSGHDEGLEAAARARRERADRIRRDARLVDTRDDTRSKLRSVK